ncbi:MAG: hypothetical protein RL215_435 [Planctomycetota bacterium]|jgi:hypothetical protein
MFFWIRELAGWGLVGASLFVLRLALALAMNTAEPRIVEAAVVLSASLGLMRAGILLIRMSTAARIARLDRDSETGN